jgi:transcriptional regulator with XRE-family HTH domain
MKKIEILFGEAVRRKRLDIGLSQEDFADKASIHRTYVSSIELGKVQVSIRIAAQLAEALDVPLSEIWKEIESRQADSS